MRGCFRGAAIILIMAGCAACAPRQLKPVAATNPAPLLEAVHARRAAMENGISGSLDLSFIDSGRRFRHRAYITAYPDGRFRLEIPGPLGSTVFVMTSDNSEILALYPDKGQAFRSSVDGRSISPHLPFPLPVEAGILPALIMGVAPGDDRPVEIRAHLMDSGEKLLTAASGDPWMQFQYAYLFAKGPGNRLREITIRGKGVEVSVRTREGAGNLPRDFTLKMEDGVLKGEWETVTPFKGDAADLRLHLPDSFTITDLEAAP